MSMQVSPAGLLRLPIRTPGDCCTLTITNGRYVLAINPLFEHASGIPGGRFSEILEDQPSVQAVMGDVDLPAGGFECSLCRRRIFR